MRRLLGLIVMALLITSCGDAGAESVTTASTLADTTTQPAPTSTTIDDLGPAAPDFTLELADGSTFTLSEAQHPVYLVFWAEW